MPTRIEALRLAASSGAVALASAIFATDILTDLPAAVSILYLAVLMLGSWHRGRTAVIGWMLGCILLDTAGFVTVHGMASDLSSLLRFVFSLIAILITSALLLSRLELQSARAAHQASEVNFENLANSVPQILWRGYPDGSCDYINSRLEEFTGLSFAPGTRETQWPAIVHPDDVDDYLRTMHDAFGRHEEFRFAFRIRHRDGDYRRAITIGRPLPDPRDPTRIAYYGGISDVNAEYAAQDEMRRLADSLEQRVEQRTAELARSEHRFRSLFYEMDIAFAETDTVLTKRLIDEAKANGVTDFQTLVTEHPDIVARSRAGIKLISMNDAVGHMLGYAGGAEVLALPRTAFIEDPDRALMLQLEAIFEGRRRSTGSATFIRKDGSRILVAFQVNYPSDGTYGLVTYIDITEQQRAHELVLAANEELARANRAATMGALSTSLAHELNQPITALAIDTRTTLRFLDQDPPDMAQGIRALERITRNVDRVNGIVRRTREQVVKGRRRTDAVALCDLALETQALLQRDLGNREATLHIRCEPGLPEVAADRVELQQVLVNLIINAADAMTGLQTRNRLIEIDIARASDEDVVVTVADNGPGIAEEDKAKVFQPFFTTKPEGMGMGLQICRSLVEAFGGALTVDNRPEGGAVFRFTLPVAAQDE